MSNSRVAWLSRTDPPASFPAVESALTEPDGLLAAGGDLSVERLLYAYQHGIFPWYDEGQPLLWWSPDPRCAFLPGDFQWSKRMRQYAKNCGFEVRVNTAFDQVIDACAGERPSQDGTWITTDMMKAYCRLHSLGWAHSIEVWDAEELIGGLYGVAMGSAFFGESMFSRSSNTSKMALLYLGHLMQIGAIDVLDCQVPSGHLQRLGARLLPRREFVRQLESSCDSRQPLQNWPSAPITVARLSQNHG